jgi:hypothetical protein
MGLLNQCQAAALQLQFFTETQRKQVAEIAELIIPTTDTPGAKAALVDRFIDLILRECYEENDRKRFVEGLDKLEKICQQTHSKPFVDCEVPIQTELLKQFEQEAWTVMYTSGEQHFFLMMKELTLLGYFTSEIGATQAARYVPIPGNYRACIPLEPGQKAWATM